MNRLLYFKLSRIVLVLLWLALVLPLCSQNGRELDSLRFSKMISRDTAFLVKYLDSYLLYIHSNGLVEDRNDHLNNIAKGSIIYQNFQIKDARYIRKKDNLFGRGLIHVQGIYKGTEFSVSLRFSNIYKKTKGVWRLLYWQSTKIA
jgi:hypothetical protein